MQKIANKPQHFGPLPASPELAANMHRMKAAGYRTTWQSTYQRLIDMGVEPCDFGTLPAEVLQLDPPEEDSLV